jgi:hypothetical protein
MKRPDFIVFSGRTDWRYDLIIDKYQSHNKPGLILKYNALLCEHRCSEPTVASEVA